MFLVFPDKSKGKYFPSSFIKDSRVNTIRIQLYILV